MLNNRKGWKMFCNRLNRKSQLFIGLLFTVFFVNSTNAQGLMSHDFDDGDKGPFVVCTTQNPNYVRVENQRLKTYWTETSYNGTRMTKGAEACGDPSDNGIGYLTIKHCWLGFTMNIDNGYMADNPNTEAGLMQIFGFDESIGYSSWTAMLDFKAGNLTWVDRRNYSNKVYALVYENFPKGVDVNIIVHAVLSANDEGMVEIFINGVKEYSRYNIDIGMGEFNDDDEQDWDSYTEFKIGQYNYKNDGGYSDTYEGEVWFDGYVEGEERIVYYDNISWYDGTDGYSIVDPSGGNNIPYSGGPRSIPGRIEVEEYDLGGEGVAYYDTTAGNAGGQFRLDDVDIAEYGGGYIVGWTSSGEWLEYTVNVIPGTYDLNLRVASPYENQQIAITLDSAVLETIDIPYTGGWFSYETVTVKDVLVSGGSNQILRIEFLTGNVNCDWVNITLPFDGDLTFDKKVNLEDVAELSVGWQSGYTMDDLLEIAANWLNGTTTNTVTIQEDETGYCDADGTIDNNNGGYTGSGFVNTDNAAGMGIDWSIDGSSGPYTITWRYAVEGDARGADLIVNGSIVSSDIPFATTGSWTDWDTQTVNVTLSSGIKSVRLEATGSSGLGNIDYIEITGPDAAPANCN